MGCCPPAREPSDMQRLSGTQYASAYVASLPFSHNMESAHIDSRWTVCDVRCVMGLIKIVRLVLVALFLAMALSVSTDCDHALASHTDADCACFCCVGAELPHPDPALVTISSNPARLRIAADLFVGDLLPADIFRPPAVA